MKTWIAILLSPAGAVNAAKTWSPLTGILVGIATATIAMSVFFAGAGAVVAEPYASTAECFEQFFPAIYVFPIFFGLFFLLNAGILSLDRDIRRSPQHKAFWLSSAPLVIPSIIWSFFGVAVMASNPQFNMTVDKTEWVHAPYVQILGSEWVAFGVIAYGIASVIYCMRKTKGTPLSHGVGESAGRCPTQP